MGSTPTPSAMILETWSNEDESCLTTSTPENILRMKEWDDTIVRLLFAVEGDTYESCMMQVHDRLGWEPYVV